MFIVCWKSAGFEGFSNILLRGIPMDSVISCRRERRIGSIGNVLLVALRSIPISNIEGTVNKLSELVGKVGVNKEVYGGRLLRILLGFLCK